ncbi:hypothetical protein E5332_04610 [Enterorhabdus sp. NM05_H27]|nr:hypothetical protein E5332_04610 [Enterorhabdus sp. NM05_H27]
MRCRCAPCFLIIPENGRTRDLLHRKSRVRYAERVCRTYRGLAARGRQAAHGLGYVIWRYCTCKSEVVKAHVRNILKNTGHATRQDLTQDFWKG